MTRQPAGRPGHEASGELSAGHDTTTMHTPARGRSRAGSKNVIGVHQTWYACRTHTRQLPLLATATPPPACPGWKIATRSGPHGLADTVTANRLNAATVTAIVAAGRGVSATRTSRPSSANAIAVAMPSRSEVQSQVRRHVSGKSKATNLEVVSRSPA